MPKIKIILQEKKRQENMTKIHYFLFIHTSFIILSKKIFENMKDLFLST